MKGSPFIQPIEEEAKVGGANDGHSVCGWKLDGAGDSGLNDPS